MEASAYVIAAMAGNFAHESNVNPGVWESLVPSTFDHEYQYDGIGGYGLGQWTNVGTPHGRLWNMYSWLTANGYQPSDGNGQLAYIVHENTWYNNTGVYADLTAFLNSTSTDLYDLTREWLLNWEGIGTGTLDIRYGHAQTFLTYIQQHAQDDPADYDWISGNMYLSTSEMCNNAMCIYFYFQGYVPPSPGGGEILIVKKKRMQRKRSLIL